MHWRQKKKAYMKNKYLLVLILIILLGFLVRFFNLTEFNIYSDSYEFLLTVKNLYESGNLDGFLGEGGEYFGPLFYNRIGFAFFLAPLYFLTHNLELSAHLLAFISGLLFLPLVYLLGAKIFNRKVGLLAALFISISFSNVMLSGFIMANTLVVLFTTLTLYVFFLAYEQDAKEWYLLAGVLFGITLFLRIEILVTLPAFLLVLILSKQKATKKSLTFSISAFFIYALFFFVSFLLIQEKNLWLEEQAVFFESLFGLFWSFVFVIVAIFFLLIYLLIKYKKWVKKQSTLVYFLAIVFSLIVVLLVPLFWGQELRWNISWFTFKVDFVLIVFGLLGMPLVLKKDYVLGLFFYFFAMPLLAVYFLFGGSIDFRHFIFLTPILGLVGAYFIFYSLSWFYDMAKKMQKPIVSLASIVFSLGLIFLLSLELYKDLKPWHESKSFEKEIAQGIKETIQSEKIEIKTALLGTFPEAYYFYTGIPTKDLKEIARFRQNLDSFDSILVVIDVSARSQLPNYSLNIEGKLISYRLKSIPSTVKYRKGNVSYFPKKLTNVYYLSVDEYNKLVREK